MAVYTIADLHLSGAVPKSMEKFGRRWTGYTEKIERRWRALVTDRDTVVIPGDISWAMDLAEAETDFRFLASLPGRKILGKGNHDFWWTTVTKMQRFLAEKEISGIGDSSLRNGGRFARTRHASGSTAGAAQSAGKNHPHNA